MHTYTIRRFKLCESCQAANINGPGGHCTDQCELPPGPMNRNQGAFVIKKKTTTTAGCQTTTWYPQEACVQSLRVKLEHETRAAAHETLTLDHRACKKHVRFNLGWTPISLQKQTTPYTGGCFNHSCDSWTCAASTCINTWRVGISEPATVSAPLRKWHHFQSFSFHYLVIYLTRTIIELPCPCVKNIIMV